MKVFISGPMSVKPNDNRAAFFKAQEELEKKGYSIWNPAWLAYPSDTEFSKDAIHAIDNEALRHCDAIYMLKGWRYSEGARAEYEIAVARDLDIMYEEECCYSFRFNLSKVPEKNAPEFDKEFAYDEAVKNRTNYQLEAIKENVKEKYTELKTIIRDLRIQCNTVDIGLGNESDRINSLECEVEAIKESIGTDHLQEQLEKDFADVYEEFQNTKDQVNDINMGYIKWSSEVSQFDERIKKLEENMKNIAANGCLGLNFNLMNEHVSSNKRDISSIKNDIDTIKDSIDNQRCTLDVISERVDNHYKKHCDDNKVVNNTFSTIDACIDDFDSRLKAIEKRLSIKPFYAPTEDEKDDD